MKTMAFWFALLFATLAAPSHAQAVWRCGADGRSYASSPCSDGRLVAVSAPRPVADVQAAHAVAARDAALADQLRRERLRHQTLALAGGIGNVSAAGTQPALKPAAATADCKGSKAPRYRSAAAGTSPVAARAIQRTPG